MNIQETIYKFIISSPRSSMEDIIKGTGLTYAQVHRAIRTLLARRLAERCAGRDGKTCVFKAVRADRRKDVKARILQLIQERGGATAIEITQIMGIPSDYARHSLRNLLDQHLLTREFVAGTKTWRYAAKHKNNTSGRSPRLVELYGLLLPVQQARLAA
ncbi:helix-turn-helix domain-containing protein [Bacillus altitudinis]|uniref:hypothetical protein n=1 Tax=Bacillus altitudinis TaxID=293387 RepID=UPI00366AD215